MTQPEDHNPLADALKRAGRDASYPPTPRLASRVRAQLQSGAARPAARGWGLWPGLAAAVLGLLLVLGGVYVYNQQTAGPTQPGTAYTVNLVDDNLTVIDLATNTAKGDISVGDSPWGVAVAPNGRRIYVSVVDGIAIVDTTRKLRTDFIPLPAGYARAKVAISADERILLVAGPSGQLTLLDMPTRGVLNAFAIEMIPYDIKLSPDGRFAYVLSQNDGTVAVVDVRRGELLTRLTFGGAYRGYFMGQSPDGRYVYVPRLARGEMWVVDTQTNQPRRVATESKPYWQGDLDGGSERGIVLSRDGRRMYVASMVDTNGGISVFDTQDFRELAHIDTRTGFFGGALSPDGAHLLLTVPGTSRLMIFEAATLKQVADVEVGVGPYRVVVEP